MASEASPFKIILGSASVARRQILADMGYQFEVLTADIDEKSIRKEKPEDLVLAIAEAKADAVLSKLRTASDKHVDDETRILITADTVVVHEGVIREKPSTVEEAREFIRGYSGGRAATVGSVVVTNLKTGVRKGEWDRVEIEEGMVLKVAGALIIEHPLILPYVKLVVGTTDSVMGLPKALTDRLIKEVL